MRFSKRDHCAWICCDLNGLLASGSPFLVNSIYCVHLNPQVLLAEQFSYCRCDFLILDHQNVVAKRKKKGFQFHEFCILNFHKSDSFDKKAILEKLRYSLNGFLQTTRLAFHKNPSNLYNAVLHKFQLSNDKLIEVMH